MILYIDDKYTLKAKFWSFEYSTRNNRIYIKSYLCLLFSLYPTWFLLRIFRLDLTRVFCNKHGFGFFCLGRFYFYDNRVKEWNVKTNFRCKRPLKIDFDDEYVFFGDYLANSNRDQKISVYKFSFITNELKKIYSCNNVRHVHAVKIISQTTLVVLCGDYEKEARMIFLDKEGNFKFEISGEGQLNRAVDCYRTGSFLYYGTDTQIEQNYLCRYSFENNEIEKLAKIGGPVFNIWKQSSDIIGFTVSCEIGLENLDTIMIYNYNIKNNQLNRIYSYQLPIRLNKFLQILFGIPTYEISKNHEKLIITNNYYFNMFRKQFHL